MTARALGVFAALALFMGLWAALAHGERKQEGNLIVSLDGHFLPLKLPRDRVAPVEVHLEGGLKTADGATLPRVTEVELGLPGQGVLNTRGLPSCPLSRLQNTTSKQALQLCHQALVGHGRFEAVVLLPEQAPFRIHAKLLAFNGMVGGKPAVIVHGFAVKQLIAIVLPLFLRHAGGRLSTRLVGGISSTLGPWPHFARFDMTFSRRFSYRGKSYSYLSASCPIPRHATVGYFSFARATYTLEDGSRIGTAIPRTCRAR